MTLQFICVECCGFCGSGEGITRAHFTGPCYTENSSTAFPAHILRGLKCPYGYEEANWEYIEKGLDIHIPRNMKSALSQRQLTNEEASVTIHNQRCRNCGVEIHQRCCPKCDWLNVEYQEPKEEASNNQRSWKCWHCNLEILDEFTGETCLRCGKPREPPKEEAEK